MDLDELIAHQPDGAVKDALVGLRAERDTAEQHAEDKHRAWVAAEQTRETAEAELERTRMAIGDVLALIDAPAGTREWLAQYEAAVVALRAALAGTSYR